MRGDSGEEKYIIDETNLHRLSFVRVMSTASPDESSMFGSSYRTPQLARVNYAKKSNILSSSISSSNSTSSPRSRRSALISPFASNGKLKLVLRLDVLEWTLADRPDTEVDGRPPVLESEVLRDEGSEASIGDVVKMGDPGLLFGALYLPPKSRFGISAVHY